MHAISEFGTSIPAFLAKLWKLVEDPKTDDLICWSPSGRSFFIRNQAQFAKELLPHYYKHNNMASFVRQLNMYGFHKKVSVELGGLKCDRDEMEFAHQYFVKGVPELVERIKRKMTSSKLQDPGLSSFKPEVVNKMLVEMRNMKGRQEHFDSKMAAMKHENQALWRELALMRQKHLKQRQIVNQLIHFLVTLVQQPSRGSGISVKRRYPLMIDDLNRQHKQSKLAKSQASPTGPVIHELDSSEPGLESEKYIVAEMLDNPTVESPQEHIEVPLDDDDIEPTNLIEDLSSVEASIQMDNLQNEIDTKKKRPCKGKKKYNTRRKNKVPVKILIPPLENGERPRKELHWVEMPDERTSSRIALLKNNKKPGRSIPVATTPSSKLAAMAANMKRENDIENSADIEDVETSDNDNQSIVKLEDILIVPEIINNDVQNDSENKERDKFNRICKNRRGHNKIDSGKSILIANEDEQRNPVETSQPFRNEKDNQNMASTSSSKDLSLSCINSGISDVNYRLEQPIEEVDNHLDTMQAGLDNMRELLRGEFLRNESYSIDANTLLGLFDKDDQMTLDFSASPELNSNGEKENDDSSIIPDVNGGEVMAYNPSSNLMDFDDLLGNCASPSSQVSSDLPINPNTPYTAYYPDPLNLEGAEDSIFDSIVPNDANTKM